MAFRSVRVLAVTPSAKKSWKVVGALGALLAAIACAGCTTTSPPAMNVSNGGGATVAFESIDGLPEPQFRKLVQALSDEANSRRLAVVSRNGPAQYRVRGYAAAHIRGRKTTVAWLWDVYDASQQRTFRITGEEPATVRQKGWGAVDDHALREMAHSGMQQLAAFLANLSEPAQPAAPEQPQGSAMTVASRDDFSPESAGIFRFLPQIGPNSAAAAPAPETSPPAASADQGAPVPVPKRRPPMAGLATHAALTNASE